MQKTSAVGKKCGSAVGRQAALSPAAPMGDRYARATRSIRRRFAAPPANCWRLRGYAEDADRRGVTLHLQRVPLIRCECFYQYGPCAVHNFSSCLFVAFNVASFIFSLARSIILFARICGKFFILYHRILKK